MFFPLGKMNRMVRLWTIFILSWDIGGLLIGMTFVAPVVKHWLKREIAELVHRERSIRLRIALRANTLPWNYASLQKQRKIYLVE